MFEEREFASKEEFLQAYKEIYSLSSFGGSIKARDAYLERYWTIYEKISEKRTDLKYINECKETQ